METAVSHSELRVMSPSLFAPQTAGAPSTRGLGLSGKTTLREYDPTRQHTDPLLRATPRHATLVVTPCL